MKKILLAFLICTSSTGLFSQSDVWSKSDRNNLFDDCMSFVTKYKKTTNEQRESISLCYIGEVTKKYTKVEFQAMIDIEIKRIKESIINQCAKNLGVELSLVANEENVVEQKVADTPKIISKTFPTKSGLIGKWKSVDNAIIEFKEDGSYVKKYLTHNMHKKRSGEYYFIQNDILTGDWFLDDKGILTIRENWSEDVGTLRTKIRNFTSTNVYQFLTYSEDYIKYESTTPGSDPIQANKIK
jgi:hypothetical protein